ncbi:MAG: peptidase [Acidobacteria bacterium]|nr:MAG: peptidase [Acidobacteriota bacterium]
MEPAINPDLPFLDLDVTPGQMWDIGWQEGTSTVQIFSFDPPGTGFDDQRDFPGAPGNNATTLGEARTNLFNAVLGAWGGTLESDVDVDVIVLWLPLPCTAGVGAVLAAAGTTFIFNDDTGILPLADVWYHAALAEAFAGADVTGPPAVDQSGNIDGGDVFVLMNSAIDDECLGPGTGYYYGLDGNPPPNLVDQAPTVLHEIGHGLGFSNFTDETSGGLVAGLPGIFDVFTLDLTTGKTWDQMTDEERRASAVNFRQVVWNGAQANAEAQNLLDPGVPELMINAPASIAGTIEVGGANFGPPLTAAGLSGEIACMKDGVPDVSYLNGCTEATNPQELAGKIALIDRGSCPFTTKVANAQAAGAIGAIIANNAGRGFFTMGGDDPSITIPAVMVGSQDGRRIREAACPETAVYLRDGRFQVSANWALPDGRNGDGVPVPLTSHTTSFWFFNPENLELFVKVLDGCDNPNFNTFWVFAAGLTNVEVTVTVTDTQTGFSRGYFKPFGPPFPPILNTDSFATCP